MIAVLTGDVVNSQHSDTEVWISKLKNLLGQWGSAPFQWEIYRGDEFQIKCSVEEVFWKFLSIKSLIKSQENLDVRIAIGIGEETFSSEKITESNGSAYINSGRLLNNLKSDGYNLAIKTPVECVNNDLNMLLKWASKDFDGWSVATAEIIHQLILYPESNQEDLAKKFNISQSSVSQRLKRANYDLLVETNDYFKNKIEELLHKV